MEVIKKNIKQAVKVENKIIIPNTGTTHNFKFLLNSKNVDLGVFDNYDEDN